MGTNFRAAIMSDLTLPWEERAADNLSLTGMLCDVENFQRCYAPYNFTSMAQKWISILVAISQCCLKFEREALEIVIRGFYDAALPGQEQNKKFVDCCLKDRDAWIAIDPGLSDFAASNLTSSAATWVTGQVIAKIHAERKPSFKPEDDSIVRVFINHAESKTHFNIDAELSRQLSDMSKLPDWKDLAPIYYATLAELALIDAIENDRTPNIEWV